MGASIPDNFLTTVIENRLKIKATVIVPSCIGKQKYNVCPLPVSFLSILYLNRVSGSFMCNRNNEGHPKRCVYVRKKP